MGAMPRYVVTLKVLMDVTAGGFDEASNKARAAVRNGQESVEPNGSVGIGVVSTQAVVLDE